jgi:hypothetical protein
MASGDRSNRIYHRQQRKSERECNAGEADFVARQNRRSATAEDQYKRSRQLLRRSAPKRIADRREEVRVRIQSRTSCLPDS